MALSCGEGGSTGSEIVEQINENTEDIESLDILVGSIVYDKRSDILDIPVSPTLLGVLLIEDLQPGIYMVGYSYTYSYDNITNSVETQLEFNGNIETYSSEPSDKTDKIPVSYSFIHEQIADTDFDFKLYLSKEDAAGVLDVQFSNLWVEKKAELPTP